MICGIVEEKLFELYIFTSLGVRLNICVMYLYLDLDFAYLHAQIKIKTVFSLNYNEYFFRSESSRVTMDPSQMFINRSFTSVNANALNLMMDGITFFKFLLLLFINLFHILNFTVYIMIRVTTKISFCFGFPAHKLLSRVIFVWNFIFLPKPNPRASYDHLRFQGRIQDFFLVRHILKNKSTKNFTMLAIYMGGGVIRLGRWVGGDFNFFLDNVELYATSICKLTNPNNRLTVKPHVKVSETGPT